MATAHTPETSWEVETTFAVAADTAAPDWTELPGIVRVGAPTSYDLSASYFDTAELTLSQARTALRRRTGGKDAGWHIKRQAEGGREEIHRPLSDAIPADFFDLLPAAISAADQLQQIAQINNHRTEFLLYDASGQTVAEFCDDRVDTQSYLVDPPRNQQWREWEVEITAAGQAAGFSTEFLAAVTKLCHAAGAEHRPDASKLQRTLFGQ